MISSPLREDTRHTTAAVVCMRNANRSFQAEVVGQDTLKLCLRENESDLKFLKEFTEIPVDFNQVDSSLYLFMKHAHTHIIFVELRLTVS